MLSIPVLQLLEFHFIISQGLLHVILCRCVNLSVSKADESNSCKGITKVSKKSNYLETAIEYKGWRQTIHWWTLHISVDLPGFRLHRCSQSLDRKGETAAVLTGWHRLQRNAGEDISTVWQWLLLACVSRKNPKEILPWKRIFFLNYLLILIYMWILI